MLGTLKEAYFRTYQTVMKTTATVLPFPVPTLLSGAGSVMQLAENISVRGLRHVLVVTDKDLVALDLPVGFCKSLAERDIKYTVFDEVQPNPTIENIEDGVRTYRDRGCDCIVAFGGGSPMDCAKGIGARLGNPFLSVAQMEGLFRVVLPIPPFFAVPTTAGTGSECTIVAVITDAASHRKFVITDLGLAPKIAVLDPELMVGLPAHITAATGMDAMTHAVEAYIGRSGSAFTDDNAERAVRLIFANLEECYRNGKNLDARYQMALASYCAGAAFTRAYIGYVHAIAHNMGGLYGVPHGLANAIILPHVLRFSRVEAQAKLAALARLVGLGEPGDPEKILAALFIEAIDQMNERMSIPTTIAELQASDIPLIAKRALEEAHPDYPVPRIMTRQQCEDLVRTLLP